MKDIDLVALQFTLHPGKVTIEPKSIPKHELQLLGELKAGTYKDAAVQEEFNRCIDNLRRQAKEKRKSDLRFKLIYALCIIAFLVFIFFIAPKYPNSGY